MNLLVPSATDDGGFHGPSLDEFFPPGFLFVGTPFEINRIIAIRILVTIVILVLFWLWTRKMTIVPRRGQSIAEMLLGFIRVNIAEDLLGKKDGTRFLPLLTAMFIMIVAMNFTGIVPGLNMAGTAVIGLPLLLALIAYVAFIYAGVKKHPAAFFKNALFPPGVPWPIYFVVTPIEFISTFILRPVTLALRLLMNMIAGHMLLVLCFSATSFFLFTAGGWFSLFSVGTFAFGFAFTIFELFVGVLQAYVFTLLTGVYIQLALAEEH
ncbi:MULTISPECIES: F0F1 ATP synthase subunit A [unclassified Leifsonia]|uniref:F0F1 ATP synthase subunit A n=1 Tax=unclassified Leifsonia TaxID=2663824 RepID=UPI0006F5B163|nr:MULTISPECIES: F0F1 ATP synthase subunit A [unclassified Leifsonia]KQX06502.1 ATP synthase F0F1 subunit A [Leifsonia sp. Root1293]KRA10785.1 ATP synthase F0F1 subunit A [Leifsonia sp. Root60]